MFAKSISTKGGDVFRDEYSLAFDGTDDYIAIPETTYDIDGGTVSFTFWAKRNDISVQNLVMAANNSYKFINLHSNGSMYIESNTNEDSASATITQDTNWHHYVITCNSGTVDMYQDGVALSMNDDSVTDDITFNKISTSSSKVFNGNISEIAIYNSVLTASQVKTIYNGREPYNHKEGVASGNLQAWYRMGDGALDGFNPDAATNGLIQSYNSQLESSIVTSWTNGSAGFNTLNTTGTNITSMINNDSGTDNVRSNSLTVATTDTYKVSFDIAGTTIPSSTNKLMFKVSPNNALNSATYDGSVTDAGSYIFYVQPQTTTIYVGFRAVEDVDCSVTNFKMQKITNNPGLMKNMASNDFEGDTP